MNADSVLVALQFFILLGIVLGVALIFVGIKDWFDDQRNKKRKEK